MNGLLPRDATASLAAEYARRAVALSTPTHAATAERYLRNAIDLEPGNPQWHLELARLQRMNGPDMARQAYATACSLGSPCAAFESAALYAAPGGIEYLPPSSIWTADRLDIAAKVFYVRAYLDPAGPLSDSDRDGYRRHIFERTAGREPESLGKTTLDDYERCFIALIESIKTEGFQRAGAIPIDDEGNILNGAHRLAVAIGLGHESVPVVRMPKARRGPEWGIRWFLQHGFKPAEVNRLLHAWVESHRNRACLLILQHGDGVDGLMAELVQRFKILGWRALCPTAKPGLVADMPEGAWRYVWVDAGEADVQAFMAQNNVHGKGRLPVRIFSGSAALALAPLLFDEDTISSWHPGASAAEADCSSVALWTRYISPEARQRSNTSGFVKWKNLQELGTIHTVIDVGVAEGTPDLYRNVSPKHVVFIEPVKIFEEKIRRLQSRFDSSQYWAVGLSSKDEDGIINYREDMPVLTSLLKSSALRDTGSEKIVRVPVALRRLDSIFPMLQGGGGPILMKIDTEGYELEALRGAVESLKKIKYLLLEVSVVERFEGSYTCRELFEFLQLHGFSFYTCLSASVDGQGVCRVIDAVFVNTGLDQA